MVINADDFYGKESFEVMAKFLNEVADKQGKYCMAGYRVGNTLSEYGSVSRGVCSTDENNFLTDVVERTSIENKEGRVCYKDENGADVEIPFDTPVSMNMWGFTPEYFAYAEEAFKAFLEKNGQELKAEFYIPTLVNDLIVSGQATCEVLDTTAKWFGVTYANDREMVVNKIQALVDAGVYPSPLF
jgi:hypothetical protein